MSFRADNNSHANRHQRFCSGGFTLLEIILATIILVMCTTVIYSMVISNLRAIEASLRDAREQSAMEGIVAYVQEQLNELPPRGSGVLLGEPLKLRGAPLDSIEWRSQGGSGLMTTAADQEYRVRFRIQPKEKLASEMEIGLWRRPVNGTDKDAVWWPMMDNVIGMEARYWDANLNSYLEAWRDLGRRPALIRLRIWRKGDTFPYEAVLKVPSAVVQ